MQVNGLCETRYSSLAYYVYEESDIEKNGEMWAGLTAGIERSKALENAEIKEGKEIQYYSDYF